MFRAKPSREQLEKWAALEKEAEEELFFPTFLKEIRDETAKQHSTYQEMHGYVSDPSYVTKTDYVKKESFLRGFNTCLSVVFSRRNFSDIYQLWIESNGSRSPSIRTAIEWAWKISGTQTEERVRRTTQMYLERGRRLLEALRQNQKLTEQLVQAEDLIKEWAKGPYRDSDLESYVETVTKQANNYFKKE